MSLRYKDISEIIGLIDASSCDEFVLETGEVKLVLRRRGVGSAPPPAAAASGPAAAISSRPGATTGSTPPAPSTAMSSSSPSRGDGGAGVVSAPMVGTFYRASSPGEPPFVEVGSKVAAGDPLGLIEVMKLFTTIHAEAGGTVKEIGAENGQLVEYGQMLFVVEPD